MLQSAELSTIQKEGAKALCESQVDTLKIKTPLDIGFYPHFIRLASDYFCNIRTFWSSPDFILEF